MAAFGDFFGRVTFVLCCCYGSVKCSTLHLELRTNEKTFNYLIAEASAFPKLLIPRAGLDLLLWWCWAALVQRWILAASAWVHLLSVVSGGV